MQITKTQDNLVSGNLNTSAYGQHLILDCYGANKEKLHCIETLFRFLDTLPAKIGMQKIGPPQIACFDDEDIKGVTGIVMIVTSHISIHTYSNKCCFFMDVFSCKDFNTAILVKYIEGFFDVKSIDIQEVVRGAQFPP